LIHPDAPDPSLTLEELKSVFNGALLRRTFVFSRKHAKHRSAVRNITFEDVVRICQAGQFKCDPRYENRNWKYEVVGKDLDGEITTVVLAVDDQKYVVTVVTFF
jgi:hypothetical protein